MRIQECLKVLGSKSRVELDSPEKNAFYQFCELVDYNEPDSMWSRICEWSDLLEVVQPTLPLRIVELGCGLSFKLMFALQLLEYTGELETVDLDLVSLDAQAVVHAHLQPGFSLKVSEQDLTDMQLHGESCLVVGNHFVDDFIANQVPLATRSYSQAYSDPEMHKLYWLELAELAPDTIANQLASTLVAHCDAPLLLNNYTSRFERNHGLEQKVTFVNDVMSKLAARFVSLGHPTEVFTYKQDVWLYKQQGGVALECHHDGE